MFEATRFKEKNILDFPLLMPVEAFSLFSLMFRDFGFSMLFNARHSRSFPTQGSLHTSNKIWVVAGFAVKIVVDLRWIRYN